jgi:hypothetical protein
VLIPGLLEPPEVVLQGSIVGGTTRFEFHPDLRLDMYSSGAELSMTADYSSMTAMPGRRPIDDARRSTEPLRQEPLMVAGGANGMLRFWDEDCGCLLWVFPAHTSKITLQIIVCRDPGAGRRNRLSWTVARSDPTRALRLASLAVARSQHGRWQADHWPRRAACGRTPACPSLCVS